MEYFLAYRHALQQPVFVHTIKCFDYGVILLLYPSNEKAFVWSQQKIQTNYIVDMNCSKELAHRILGIVLEKQRNVYGK